MKIRSVVLMFGVACMLVSNAWCQVEEGTNTMNEPKNIYAFTMKNIAGQDVCLSNYAGQVAMIVNTASKCGFTGQYEGLQKIYDKYKDKGFVILGFPANDFMGQEPGTDEQIQTFCSLKYHVTFPMFSKIAVKGKKMHPLYRYLTEKKTNPEHGGAISWNFNKFLIGRDGAILNRFGTRTAPEDKDVIAAIEKALDQGTK